MGNLKISSRLYILLVITTAAFSLMLLITQFGMSYLGDLQDAGYKRNSESNEMLITAKIGPVMYRVIADSIINRNLTESAKDWAEIKITTEKMLARASELADTPEEKKSAEQAKTAHRALISLYESQVLPLLKADADLKQIRPLDDEMDKYVTAINDALTPFASSLTADAEEADKQFDATRARIISGSLATALVMLSALITISLYVRKSIIQQLGGEPRYAMEVSRRIAAGDLSTRVEIAGTSQDSLMASIKVMQEQLAQLIRKVLTSSANVSSLAAELAAASSQVSASASQQSDDTVSVAASIEQLTVSIDIVAGNAQEAEQIATESGSRSDQGALQVKDATDEMTRIAHNVKETAQQMATLTAQSQQISSIANVIKEVADQTNLLALNAAIEAARAGEQGRGFAVVADEVRKLAERTTRSADEISSMIASIQSHTEHATAAMQQGNQRVTEGVVLAGRAGDSMRLISEGSKGVVQAVTGISHSLREQKSTSGAIAKRVEHIAHMTEETSTVVSQVAANADRLKSMADELKQAVAGFRV
ncbi:methyl-accepting chemotaxis protein [Aquitalea sp. FJL05]|uniref:methyl-accepting chemotaxis protein n=1 Tax=Aquitalea TaxID=407217 RepID=UPI000F5AD19A|nr:MULTISPECIES: methyl-accepting chemotaxis protein [Aquitalea]RQO69222.1 methyl-accepting chemotaxis protein [Aquitalea sp. FJL05]